MSHCLAPEPAAPDEPARSSYLYILPKLCWATALVNPQGHHTNGKNRRKEISNRLARCLRNDWVALYNECMATPLPAPAAQQGDHEQMEEEEPPPLTADQASDFIKRIHRGEQAAALSRLNQLS